MCEKRVRKTGPNTVDHSTPLPIIDGHCHVFGQALFEGGDLIDLVESQTPFIMKGTRRFLAYSMKRDLDNARTVLKGVPRIVGQNKVPHAWFASAAVPLLLDMGYTPLVPPGPKFARYRGQEAITEREQIKRTDRTEAHPNLTGKKMLRLEALYCRETEDYTGDDDIHLQAYANKKALTVVDLEVDHNNQTRMINRKILFDARATELRLYLYERDVDPDDFLGWRRIDLEAKGWRTLVFKNAPGASKGTHYEIIYSVSTEDSNGDSDSADGSEAQGGNFILSLDRLECIDQEDWTGDDKISIEVRQPTYKRYGKKYKRDKFGPYKCDAGDKPYMIDKNMVIGPRGATLRLWEIDSGKRRGSLDNDDFLGYVKIPAQETLNKTVSFKEDGANYKLAYSVAPGDVSEKDDEYYPSNRTYLWFKRDRATFEGTIRALARAASQLPGRIWPLAPFDPRRPHGLDCVKEAIDKLGFVGVKLYSRCGWMPLNNREIHGDELGKKLDDRLQDFYKYLTDNGLPVLNHTSPTGYPPDGQLALPKLYYEHSRPPEDYKGPTPAFKKPGFPPLWTVRSGTTLRAAITQECAKFASYCHYVQKTTSPYAWLDVLAAFKGLRLCFAHTGSDVGVYGRYRELIDRAFEDKGGAELKKAFKDSALLEERIRENPFVLAGKYFRQKFIDAVTYHAHDERVVKDASDNNIEYYSREEIRQDVTAFIDKTKDWSQWLADWENTYPDDWTTKIIKLEQEYDNVYSDIAYISGDEGSVFEELVRQLAGDAKDGTVGKGATGKKAGKIMETKHFVGTDWYMTEVDRMNPRDFWNRVRRAMGVMSKPGDTKPDDNKQAERWALWSKWVTTNTLDWLNLKPRLAGKGIEKLNAFYEEYARDVKSGDKLKLPPWWEGVEKYYDAK